MASAREVSERPDRYENLKQNRRRSHDCDLDGQLLRSGLLAVIRESRRRR